MRTCILLLSAAVTLSAADDVLSRVAAHAGRVGDVSRQIWETPELAFHENRSSVLLQQELKANGFTVKADLAGMPTAFTAEWGSGSPVIGIMGEFDALPGLSQKDIPTISPVTDGAPGHGCGHNLLGSASALAVVAIKEEMQARGLKGTIRYYGTPAEEGGGGKIVLARRGAFDFAFHTVIEAVAQHMQQRLGDRVDDALVGFGGGALDHQPRALLRQKIRALQVGADQFVEALFGGFEEVAALARSDTSIVDEKVEALEVLAGEAHQGIPVVVESDVALDDFAAGLIAQALSGVAAAAVSGDYGVGLG